MVLQLLIPGYDIPPCFKAIVNIIHMDKMFEVISAKWIMDL